MDHTIFRRDFPRLLARSRTGILYWCCLLLLCSAYLQGGIDKAWDFAGAQAEMRTFSIEPATPMAVLVIIGELGASFLILSGVARWAGAAYLAVFTFAANLVANRFWELTGMGRQMSENGFFEHLGLVGAMVLVASIDLAERKRNAAAARVRKA